MNQSESEFVYDIKFCLAEDACLGHQSSDTQTLRVRVTDPHPTPGYGPALGTIHRALRDTLRETDPETYGLIRVPGDLVILAVTAA